MAPSIIEELAEGDMLAEAEGVTPEAAAIKSDAADALGGLMTKTMPLDWWWWNMTGQHCAPFHPQQTHLAVGATVDVHRVRVVDRDDEARSVLHNRRRNAAHHGLTCLGARRAGRLDDVVGARVEVEADCVTGNGRHGDWGVLAKTGVRGCTHAACRATHLVGGDAHIDGELGRLGASGQDGEGSEGGNLHHGSGRGNGMGRVDTVIDGLRRRAAYVACPTCIIRSG